jgi:hypothetical protein
MKFVVRVSKESITEIKKFAKARDLDMGEAADRMITTAAGRNAAVARYTPKPQKRKVARTRKPKAEAAE